MVRKSKNFIISLLLMVVPLFALVIGTMGVSSALSCDDTWTGNNGDGDWGQALNWSTGTIPATGSNVCIDNSAASFTTSPSIENVTGSYNSITFENDNSNVGAIELDLTGPLTIDSAITQDVSDSTTVDFLENSGTAEQININGNVTVTSNAGLFLGDGTTPPVDTIDLGTGANTLTFTTISTNGSTVDIADTISGSGTVVYNNAGENAGFLVEGDNTYTGTTNVEGTAGNSIWGVDATNNNAFGVSSINVASTSGIYFESLTSGTVSNQITVAGSQSTSPITALDFSSDVAAPGTTVNFPNIILDGDTALGGTTTADYPLSVNLTGIQANGNCVDYIGGTEDDSPAGSAFTGTGLPTGCELNSGNSTSNASSTSASPTTTAKTPGTPDTGLAAAHMNNPFVILAITSALSLAIFYISRRVTIKTQAPKTKI